MCIRDSFTGLLNIQRSEIKDLKAPSKTTKGETKPSPEQKEVVELINDTAGDDDISLGDENTMIEISNDSEETMEEEFIEPEEEAIDIDDDSASGRLSALRKEMASDSNEKPESRDDLSKRLDSFLKDR